MKKKSFGPTNFLYYFKNEESHSLNLNNWRIIPSIFKQVTQIVPSDSGNEGVGFVRDGFGDEGIGGPFPFPKLILA